MTWPSVPFTTMPAPVLPEMTLRVAAVVPPMTAFVAAAPVMLMPLPFAAAAVPAALVPM